MKQVHWFLGLVFVGLLLSSCADSFIDPQESSTTDEPEITPPAAIQGSMIDTRQSNFELTDKAFVQIIHNAADPRARVVDIYLNGAKAIDNFHYHRATAFLELPFDLQVAVAPNNSKSVADALANFDFQLTPGGTYVVVANGVLPRWKFGDNPEGLPINFDLFPLADAHTEAADPGSVDLLVFHGATDAPTVDVVARNVGTLVDNIAYGEFQGYVSVPPANFTLDITTADGAAIARSFKANFRKLGGEAITLLASGFLTPPAGPSFNLIAVLADGRVVILPK